MGGSGEKTFSGSRLDKDIEGPGLGEGGGDPVAELELAGGGGGGGVAGVN